MLATLVIVFREAVEAGLVVGIILAATKGVPGRGRYVAAGVAAGVLGACMLAVFAGTIADAFDGAGQELLNAGILAVAVVMLAWHVVWMARHGRAMATELRQAGADISSGRRPLAALAVVVGVAVLREGVETVLFLYGIAIGGEGGWSSLLLGGALGLGAAVALSALTYAGLVRIPVGRLFTVTGWLVTLLAAGLAAQCAGFLQQSGFVTALGRTAWNSAAILPSDSIPGRVLHTLIGYTDHPTTLQVVVWAAVLGTILLASRAVRTGQSRPRTVGVAPAVETPGLR